MINDRTLYNQKFQENKAVVNYILSIGGNFPSDGKVDAGIRDLVYQLNRLPIVYSWCSCSGHFTTREDIFKRAGTRDERVLILPNNGYGDYSDGYLGLVFKPSSDTRRCILDIKQVVKQYPNASIEAWPSIINTNLRALQGLNFEITFDNIQQGSCEDESIIPIAQGLKRRKSVTKLISNLDTVFSGYD